MAARTSIDIPALEQREAKRNEPCQPCVCVWCLHVCRSACLALPIAIPRLGCRNSAPGVLIYHPSLAGVEAVWNKSIKDYYFILATGWIMEGCPFCSVGWRIQSIGPSPSIHPSLSPSPA
jgi:hypothetical protein